MLCLDEELAGMLKRNMSHDQLSGLLTPKKVAVPSAPLLLTPEAGGSGQLTE